MTKKRFTLTNQKNAFQEMKCGIDDKTFDKTLTFNEVVDILNRFQDLSIDDLNQIEQLKKENEQLRQAKKFFEEILFNVIYATSDYQRLVLNKELLEVIDECKSLDELREKANYGIEEFKEEHKWLE